MMDKLGKLAVGLLVAWLLVVVAIGVAVTIRNGIYF